MEHHHHLQRHLSPTQTQEDLMISPDFFVDVDQLHFHDADVGGGSGGFEPVAATAGVVVDDGAWMEDLMQLGDELFGENNEVVVDAMADDDDRLQYQLEAWYDDHQQQEDSPEQPCSYDDVISPGGSGDHQGPVGDDNGDLSATRKRRDRSKTIVSERKRRFRMKEKLYELRSLVPNITKVSRPFQEQSKNREYQLSQNREFPQLLVVLTRPACCRWTRLRSSRTRWST